eukprot:Pgem_evm1s19012
MVSRIANTLVFTVASLLISSNNNANAAHEGPLRATFDNSIAKGYFDYKSFESGGAKYYFQLQLRNTSYFDDCTDEDGNINLNYHVHLGAPDVGPGGGVTSECGANAGSPPIGGHYDPTLACGPATGETANCEKLGRNGTQYDCNPDNYGQYPFNCEVGDLSNKFGQAKFYKSGDNYKTYKYRIFDSYGAPAELVEGRSVVFHCG